MSKDQRQYETINTHNNNNNNNSHSLTTPLYKVLILIKATKANTANKANKANTAINNLSMYTHTHTQPFGVLGFVTTTYTHLTHLRFIFCSISYQLLVDLLLILLARCATMCVCCVLCVLCVLCVCCVWPCVCVWAVDSLDMWTMYIWQRAIIRCVWNVWHSAESFSVDGLSSFYGFHWVSA